MSPIPNNVVDKQLYGRIKEQIHQDLKAKNTRWGIYASSRLTKEYKKRGGRYVNDKQYKNEKNELTGLNRWYKQEWINICESEPPKKIVKCGRQNIENKYPVCRPYKRVSEKTPTTWEQMDHNEISRICNQKRRDPLKILPKIPLKK